MRSETNISSPSESPSKHGSAATIEHFSSPNFCCPNTSQSPSQKREESCIAESSTPICTHRSYYIFSSKVALVLSNFAFASLIGMDVSKVVSNFSPSLQLSIGMDFKVNL